MALEAAEEFQSSLNDLTFNSKPLINMLTMLAEENVLYAAQIVQVIEAHIQKAPPAAKLPCVYLVDSILKNIQVGNYKHLFAQNLVHTFCGVFEKVDEKTRQSMFKLRQTWTEMFPATKLYALDVRVNHIDPAWPITANPDFSKGSIHVNPKFIVQQPEPDKSIMADMEHQEAQMRQQLIAKQQELLKLQQQQLELELAETKVKLAAQQKELDVKNRLLEDKKEESLPPTKGTKPSVAGVPLEKLNIRDPRLAKRLEGKQVVKPEPQAVIPDIGIDIPGLSTTVPDASPASATRSPEKKTRAAEKKASPKDPRSAALERWKPDNDKKDMAHGTGLKQKDPRLSNRKTPPRSKTTSKTGCSKLNKNESPGRGGHNRALSSRSSNHRSDRDRDRRDVSRSTSKEKDDKRSERGRRNYRSSNRERSPSPDTTKVRRRSDSSQRSRSRSPRSSKSSPSRRGPEKSSEKSQKEMAKSVPSKTKKGDTSFQSDSQDKDTKNIGVSKDKDDRPVASAGRRQSQDIDERRLPSGDSSPSTKPGGKLTSKRERQPETSRDKDERQDVPSPKRSRPDDKEDLRELFGSEDQDYRSPPGVSLSQSYPPPHLGPKSPHLRWAKFKANNPAEFEHAQPSPSRPPLISTLPRIPRRKPSTAAPPTERQLSGDSENLDIPKALLIDQQDLLLKEAERRLSSGQLSHQQHQELLKQLAELYKLQKQQEEIDRSKKDADYRVGQGGLLSSGKNKTLLPIPDVDRSLMARRPLLPAPKRGKMPWMGGGGGGSPADLQRGPAPPYARLPRPRLDGPHGPRPELRHPVLPMSPPPMPPIYGKKGPSTPFNDMRFQDVLREKKLIGAELVIDDRSFELTPGLPPRVFKAFGMNNKISANADTREILINGKCKYRMGDPMREIIINGETHTIYFHGALSDVWIDGVQYNIRFDAPPQRIMIGPEQHEIAVNSTEMKVYIDCLAMGPWGGPPREVTIDGRKHELRFEAPPREILIDSKLCQLNFQYVIPIIMIDNKPHGIRFDGPPRAMTIDGIDYLIPMDMPVKIKLGKRPHQISFGGPGYEVIMGGKCYEVQFNGPPRDIWLGGRVRKVQLKGPPPEVKILDEIRPVDMKKLMKVLPFSAAPSAGPPVSGLRQLLHRPRPQGPRHEYDMRPIMNNPSTPMTGRFPPPREPMAMPGPRMQHPLPRIPEPVPNLQLPQPMDLPPVNHTPTQIDVNDLFSKLLTAGIITKTDDKPAEDKSQEAEPVTEEEKEKKRSDSPLIPEDQIEDVPDLTELDVATMKERFEGVLQRLYTGIQCSSCGTRFTHDETEAYREHLDWHFRQNKRDKDEVNVAKCRKWFYTIQDWIMYMEIDDSEEAGQMGYFGESGEDEQSQAFAAFASMEGVELEPVATGEDADDTCAVCGDPFDQVWHEEKEEWHLKEALRTKGKTYHHVCYDDALQASMSETPTPLAGVAHQPFFPSPEAGDAHVKPEPDAGTVKPAPAPDQGASTKATPNPLTVHVKSEPAVEPDTANSETPQSPGTPVKDEPMKSPGTPVCDEILSPGTPLKDEAVTDDAEPMDTSNIKTEPTDTSVTTSVNTSESGADVTTSVGVATETSAAAVKTEPESDIKEVNKPDSGVSSVS